MIVAGIDEAGYGPVLGPLCAGLAAFRVGGASTPEGAGEAVARALSSAPGLRYGDSKAIHRPGRPAALETPLLALLAARDGAVPRSGAALLAALRVPAPPADHPWYRALPGRPLPMAADRDAIEEGAGALAAGLAREGVEVAALEVRAVAEGRFNEGVAREGSKAGLLFLESAALLERAAASAAGGAPLDVLCDRQGARARYGPLLRRCLPGREVRVLREGPRSSAYAVDRGDGPMLVRYEVGADAAAAATGVASMAAKYVRELHMACLNEWLLREAPGVRATAGYWTDGHRFLRETAEARRRLGVPDGVFVRSR